jgi:transposase-like protein
MYIMAKYDNEFKREIAELVNNKIKTRSEIKHEYGIAPSTVVSWEKKLFGDLKKRDDLSPQELEIIKLKKILKEKEEENDI